MKMELSIRLLVLVVVAHYAVADFQQISGGFQNYSNKTKRQYYIQQQNVILCNNQVACKNLFSGGPFPKHTEGQNYHTPYYQDPETPYVPYHYPEPIQCYPGSEDPKCINTPATKPPYVIPTQPAYPTYKPPQPTYPTYKPTTQYPTYPTTTYQPSTTTHTTTTEPTTTHVPTTEPPTTTHVPTTEPPTTHVPITEPPTTHVPITEPPTTHVPITEPPTTTVPTTQPPTTTVPTTPVPTTPVPTTPVPTTQSTPSTYKPTTPYRPYPTTQPTHPTHKPTTQYPPYPTPTQPTRPTTRVPYHPYSPVTQKPYSYHSGYGSSPVQSIPVMSYFTDPVLPAMTYFTNPVVPVPPKPEPGPLCSSDNTKQGCFNPFADQVSGPLTLPLDPKAQSGTPTIMESGIPVYGLPPTATNKLPAPSNLGSTVRCRRGSKDKGCMAPVPGPVTQAPYIKDPIQCSDPTGQACGSPQGSITAPPTIFYSNAGWNRRF